MVSGDHAISGVGALRKHATPLKAIISLAVTSEYGADGSLSFQKARV